MKEVVIISGKGGTGKTSLVAAFASLAEKKVLCDADVDAADLHLVMDPEIIESHEFQGGGCASINLDECTACGLCRELCRWNAISETFVVNDIGCEGCAVCVHFCPEDAIEFHPKTCGEWFLSETRFGPIAHARLGIAEENSGKLVTLVRNEGKKLAEARNIDLLITDGPPGIGCPVIASIGGAAAVLIVTEPTIAGRHDMERVAELAAYFRVPAMVCINKYDLNIDQSRDIIDFAHGKNLSVLGQIPFDPTFTKAMVQGKTIVEYDRESEGCKALISIWGNLAEKIQQI